jgi:hypothetical protein
MKKYLKKQITFYVPKEQIKLAWAFLNKNFRSEKGNPKYFDYLSVKEGSGYITITVYKNKPVTYRLLTLPKDWYKDFNSLKAAIFQNYKKLIKYKGFFGYP